MQLSKNFALSELTFSEKGSRLGLDNTPDAHIIQHLQRLANTCLQPARDALGPMHVFSGYRCAAVNKAVGGSKTSAHMQGFAGDVYALGMTRPELALWLSKHVPFDQIILEFVAPGAPNTGWVHIGLAAGELRRQTLTARKIGGKTVYIPGFVV